MVLSTLEDVAKASGVKEKFATVDLAIWSLVYQLLLAMGNARGDLQDKDGLLLHTATSSSNNKISNHFSNINAF